MDRKVSGASTAKTAVRRKNGQAVSARLVAQAKRQLAAGNRQRRRAGQQPAAVTEGTATPVAKRPRDFVSLFTQITEPRREGRVTHSLLAIMFMSVAAVLAGAEGPEDIADFAKQHTDWIKRFVPLPNGVPSHDTIGRVLSLINPAEFQQSFLDWLGTWTDQPILTPTEYAARIAPTPECVAIDGKSCCNSHTQKQPHPLHLVSAWSTRLGLTLGQVAVREKSNEITAIPKLLELLELKNAIVSIDAMGCQKEIAAQIIAREGHYVLAVKGNQPTLNSQVSDFFMLRGERNDWETLGCRKQVTQAKSRGRDETRTYYVAPLPPELQELTNDWVGLRSIGMVQSVTIQNGKTSEHRIAFTNLYSLVRGIPIFSAISDRVISHA